MSDARSLSRALRGQMTALVTSYEPGGAVDVAGVRAHVRFQLERGVRVLAGAGTIGDSPYLSPGERSTVVRAVAEETGDDGVTVAGIPSDRPEEAVEATAAMARAGAKAVLVMVPALLRLTEAEQWAFWEWFDRRTALPFVVYSTPHASSGPLSEELAERLTSLRHVVAIKDAFPDVPRLRRLVSAAGDLPVVAAAEKVLPEAVDAGVAGFMTASSCFAPELMWHLWLACREGRSDVRVAAFARVTAFRSLFQTEMDAGFPAFMPATRAACEARGLPVGPARFPLGDVSPQMRVLIDERVAAMTRPPFAALPPAITPAVVRSQERWASGEHGDGGGSS